MSLQRIDTESRLHPARLALNTYRLYRRAGCGLRESFRNAWRAYRRAN